MGFDLLKIKNLFIESTAESDSTTQNQSTGSSLKSETPTNLITENKLDKTIVDALLKVLEDHNLPGEDYLEFMQALKAMESIPLEESMKVQTVMATLSTKGLSVAKIRESADYYKNVLLDEQKQFKVELDSQVDKSIKSKEKSIESLQLAIKDKSGQIAILTKEITEAQQSIASTEQLINSSKSKIQTAEANFNQAYNFVINQINENLNKLK